MNCDDLTDNSSVNEARIVQAKVPWRNLRLDVSILAIGVVAPCVSLFIDLVSPTPRHILARSGGVMIVASAYIAFLSLRRHALKAKVLFEEGEWRLTSRNQLVLDWSAVVLSVSGTLLWAYGDLAL